MSLQENIIFSGVSCPRCGRIFFGEYPGPKTIFHCMHKQITGTYCSGVVCKCLKCDKVYPSTSFRNINGVYCCIYCNTPQLDYTKLKETDNMIKNVHSRLEAIRKEMENL